MAQCVTLDTAVNLTPDCAAKNKVGGASKVFYVGSHSELGTEGQGTNGEMTSLTMAVGKKLVRLEGKKEKNAGTVGSEQTDNGALYNHGGTFVAYYSTQEQKNTIEALGAMDDLFVIIPTPNGQVEAYGFYNKNGRADGMTVTVNGGTGTAKGDSSAMTLEFAGQASRLPVYVNLGVDYDATIAALEAETVV
jgi:hypothetical protein